MVRKLEDNFITSNNEQFEEKCHILLPFRMLFVAKQAHVPKIYSRFVSREKEKNYLLHTKIYTFICKMCLTVYYATYKTTNTRLWKTLIYLWKFNPNKNADVHTATQVDASFHTITRGIHTPLIGWANHLFLIYPLLSCWIKWKTTAHAHCVHPSTAWETGATLYVPAVCRRSSAVVHRQAVGAFGNSSESVVPEPKN